MRVTSHSSPRVSPIPIRLRGIVSTVSNNNQDHANKLVARELRFPKNVKKTRASQGTVELEKEGGKTENGRVGESEISKGVGKGCEREEEGVSVSTEEGKENIANKRASNDFTLRMNVKASMKPAQQSLESSVEIGHIDEFDEMDYHTLQTLVNEVQETVTKYFKSGPDDTYLSVQEVVGKFIRSSAKIYGEKEAKKWATGFTWPQEALQADQDAFRAANYNIQAMAIARQNEIRAGRLNLDRLKFLSPDNPERHHFTSLCGGIIVPKPEGFRPNAKCEREIKEVLTLQTCFLQWSNNTSRRAPLGEEVKDPQEWPAAKKYDKGLHPSYQKVFPAVDKLLYDIQKQGLGWVLSKDLLQQHDSVHLSLAKWAEKYDKMCGRNTSDLSFGVGPILNGVWAKDAAAQMYGEVHHPSIIDIVLMILDVWDKVQVTHPGARMEDLYFYKVDVSGAYTWLDFRPEDVYCFAQELADDKIFISLVGVFGASILPAAFNVITKAYRFEVQKTTRGGADVYVDDGFGCCLLQDLEWEMNNATSIFENILGEKCIKKEKNVSGRVVAALGWDVDLELMIISIADKNLDKAGYCLFTVNLEKGITLVEVQRIASYCQRYVIILEVMAPFLACIHRLMTGKVGWMGTFEITKEAKWAIKMWRAAFYLLAVDKKRYGRPMASFRPRDPDYIIETDGSLSQVGIILYKKGATDEACVGGAAVSLMSFGFGKDSSNQNLAEYLGMVMGVLALIKLGVRDADVVIRGDSTTALTWMTEGRIKGKSAINAAVVVTALCIRYGIRPRYAVFLSGVRNFKADTLSRLLQNNMTIEQAMIDNGHGDCPILDLRADPSANTLIEMCNPKIRIEDEDEFTSMWQTVREAMETITVGVIV